MVYDGYIKDILEYGGSERYRCIGLFCIANELHLLNEQLNEQNNKPCIWEDEQLKKLMVKLP